MDKPKKKHKQLTIKAEENSALGMVIAYLQSQPTDPRLTAKKILVTRFLPFAISTDNSAYEEIVLNSIHQCEGWSRLIRECTGFGNPVRQTAEFRARCSQLEKELALVTRKLADAESQLVRERRKRKLEAKALESKKEILIAGIKTLGVETS